MADFNEPLSRNEAILQNILGASNELLPPQSRVEAILQAILNDTAYTNDPQSVIEELLIAIKNSGEFDKETESRNEKILLAKLKGEPYTEEPQSRIEDLLIKWLVSYEEKTATGAIVTLTDAGAGKPFIEVSTNITPTQSGSGDPSPTNVRPINGQVGGVAFSHSGADTSNPTIYSFAFPSEENTVYGGFVDLITGVLTVTHTLVNLGARTWSYASQFNCFNSATSGETRMKPKSDLLCSHYPYKGSYQRLTDKSCAYIFDTSIAIRDSDYNGDAAAFKAAMNGVQMVYELATPIEYQLQPKEITALSGTNNLWADTGNITVTYLAVK